MIKIVILSISFLGSVYCLFTKSYKRGLILFLIYTSCVEGPLKIMTWGEPIKKLVYIIRDLMLYILFVRAMLENYFIKQGQALGLPKPPYTRLILFYVIWCSMMVFHPEGVNMLNSIAGLRIHIEMIPLFFFGYYLMNSKKDYLVLFLVIILCALLNSVVSFVQAVRGVEWLYSIHPGYKLWATDFGRTFHLSSGKELIRPPALGPDMGFAGFYAIYVFPMLLILFTLFKKAIHRAFLAGCFIILIFGVFSSQARSAYALTFIVILLYFLTISQNIIKKVKSVFIIGIIMVVGFWLVYRYFPYLTQRFETVKTVGEAAQTITVKESWRFLQITGAVVGMAFSFPLGDGLGKVGPGALIFAPGYESRGLNAENQLTLGIAEIGIPGIVLLFLFHINVFLFGRRKYIKIKDSEVRLYLAVPMTIMGLLFVYWPFVNLISFPNNSYFWFCAGILCRFGAYAEKGAI